MLSPTPVQRLEGLALLILAIVLYAWSGQSWWWFAALLLVPDVSMIGYARGPGVGAAIYNLGHALVWPSLFLALGIPDGRSWLVAIGSIWLAHIGMDRSLGYGLKLDEGFKHTHLGMIGPR
ncbi:MAG: DUF4260 domain-containing protein [Acidimicrobiia bacterium]